MNKAIFTSFIFFLITISLKASECSLAYSTMYLIALNEKAIERPIGYPYLISFNSSKNVAEAKKTFKKVFMNSRTIDCKNVQLCTKITKSLINNGMSNLDLGAFQINYHYHKIKIKDYFIIEKSYEKSCNIAEQFIDSKNVTFEDIARYHSSTKKYNAIYAKRLKKNYNRLASK